MRKVSVILLIALLIFPLVSSALEVTKKSSNEVLIPEIGEPATFELSIKNTGPSDNFEFYNLLGFKMFPVGTVFIGSGAVEDVRLQISPLGDFPYRGYYTFTYYIKGQNTSVTEKELTFRAIDLEDAFEVGAEEVGSESDSINVYIKNKVNFDFGEMSAEFTSSFFDFSEDFSFGPNERKDFEVKLNKDDFKKLLAGFYTIDSKIEVKGKTVNIDGTIKFGENDALKTSEDEHGFFINTKVIEKVNEGNVIVNTQETIKKNTVSRLFTSFSPEPDIVGREGSAVYYTWNRNIKPGESLEIVVKTNWLFPLITILFIIVLAILIRRYSGEDLALRKRVSFVKTKGGEFALRVFIVVNAKKYVERVSIIDRLPALVKIHERFGGQQPKRVDEKTKRIEWGFEKLEPGEVRTISYIIYSKVGIVGKFALPAATGIYEKEGEIKETQSNRAFFVAEQKPVKEEDEY